jgi:hypothetical protein
MHTHGAHAATDVTGFGILGHAQNLASNQVCTSTITLTFRFYLLFCFLRAHAAYCRTRTEPGAEPGRCNHFLSLTSIITCLACAIKHLLSRSFLSFLTLLYQKAAVSFVLHTLPCYRSMAAVNAHTLNNSLSILIYF